MTETTLHFKPAIAVDLDGVLWSNAWPEMGAVDLEMIRALQFAQSRGYLLIADTCREGKLLDQGLVRCRLEGLEFDYVNENDPARIAAFGGDCRKMSVTFRVDDTAFLYEREAVIAALYDLPDVREPSTGAVSGESPDVIEYEPIAPLTFDEFAADLARNLEGNRNGE